MALDNGAGGGGAIMLQEVLKNLADRAFQQQSLQQAAARTAIDQQNADTNEKYRMMQEADTAAKNAEAVRARGVTEGLTHGANTPIGTNVINDQMLPQMRAAGLPISDVGPTLGSRNLSGGAVAQGLQAPPRILGLAPSGAATEGLASTQNPGQGAKAVYGGTDKQQEAATREAATNRFATAHPEYKDAIIAAGPEGAKTLVGDFTRENMAANKQPNKPTAIQEYEYAKANGFAGSFMDFQKQSANLHNTPPALITVQTVDDQGNRVTKVVPKTAGTTFITGPSATLENRLASANAALQTGQDIMSTLKDPQTIATLGPAMGRVSSMADWIGNPPPEYAELMGNIHSYALAQLGIHGMRSSQASEQIRKDLSGVHTPEALAAYITGLSKFSQHLIDNNRNAAGGSAPSAGSSSDFKVIGVRDK